jgi:adenylate cyclase
MIVRPAKERRSRRTKGGDIMQEFLPSPHRQRKLAAIFAVDVAGYSLLTGVDEEGTLGRLRALRRERIDPSIVVHHGRIFKSMGDGVLAEFASVVDAVRCAIDVQRGMTEANTGFPPDRRMNLRVGIHLGDVVLDGDDLLGDGVNIATRLEGIAPPGGICVSSPAYDQVRGKIDAPLVDLGTKQLKNIAQPVRVYRIDFKDRSIRSSPPERDRNRRKTALMGAVAVSLALSAGAAWRFLMAPGPKPPLAISAAPASLYPRLSIVVLPFANLGNVQADEYLSDGITDDLTTELSQLVGAFVIAHESALTYRGKTEDLRKVGRELGVRYVVEGSVRRVGEALRVNAQLISTETGANIWANRFDEPMKDLSAGQEEIARHIASALGVAAVNDEAARSARATNPDAFDLILRARSITNQPESQHRYDEAETLYERALKLDPTSVEAMTGLYAVLYTRRANLAYWPSAEMQARATKLLPDAQALAPTDRRVLTAIVQGLILGGRGSAEVAAACQRLIEASPNSSWGFDHLARTKVDSGKADEAIPLFEKAIQLNPHSSNLHNTYNRLGYALLMVGRYDEAILSLQRALAANPESPPNRISARVWKIAVANALSGRLDDARRAFDEANRLWPYSTLRTDFSEDPEYPAQVQRMKDAMRLVGERDHAEEDADFGVAPGGELHADQYGFTPKTAPGVTTIRTTDLQSLLTDRKPLVITTGNWPSRHSIPTAVCLKESGNGGSFSDTMQDRLRRKSGGLTKGEKAMPIVAVGVNSERFDGLNLALRLAALGYSQVYWYRGGNESWEVNGLPTTECSMPDW